jgi:hypothetical protein
MELLYALPGTPQCPLLRISTDENKTINDIMVLGPNYMKEYN